MKRKVIKGKDLMIFVSGKAIALATSCNIDLTATTEDAASKDSGGWDDPEVTGYGWSGGSENICGADEDASQDITYDELLEQCMSGEPVDIKFGIPANANNEGVPDGGWLVPSKGYSGKAIIESVKITAANKQNGTVSVSLKGKGKLEKIKPS
ncbi:phage tail protein [Parabacteroides sp. AM08-6]|uniref:phage tail tube protein n=1 Tax=Parabacteroides sp. AM08-6 TaxID=2292053 RepID=UPI000EFFFDCB|nr:phage tail protein [Parabacteroides sp. AM08-6]RHJ76222.1 phage tail protein [Parabacteroides sp. AM08-6]